MFRMTVLKHAVFLSTAKATSSIFFQIFLIKNMFYLYTSIPQKSKYDNQALMKHLTACSNHIRNHTKATIYIQNVCTNTLTYKG